MYNSLLETSKRALFLSPSDIYVRSFLYLFYTLIKHYYMKKSEWSRFITGPRSESSSPEAKSPGIGESSLQQHFNTEDILSELSVF